MNAERLMMLGGMAAFCLTFYWVRGRQLREKYAVAWMSVATVLLLLGLFPQLIKGFAENSGLAYPSAVLFLALGAIYLFSMSVSLSLTRTRRTSVRLMQDLALTRYEVEGLQQRLSRLEHQFNTSNTQA
ncbi:DUF2304 family protein [bacterium]|nr:DUF2304 family protein [bacterium]